MPDINQSPMELNGECSICGLPGVIGMRCSDPDCSGTVEGLPSAKSKNDDSNERYSDELLSDANERVDDDDGQLVSLETLADDEVSSEPVDES